MEIKQIFALQDDGAKIVFGLGVDNNVYRWAWKENDWQPTWSTGEKRTATFVEPQRPNSRKENPGR